jgi:hypothetical protein
MSTRPLLASGTRTPRFPTRPGRVTGCACSTACDDCLRTRGGRKLRTTGDDPSRNIQDAPPHDATGHVVPERAVALLVHPRHNRLAPGVDHRGVQRSPDSAGVRVPSLDGRETARSHQSLLRAIRPRLPRVARTAGRHPHRRRPSAEPQELSQRTNSPGRHVRRGRHLPRKSRVPRRGVPEEPQQGWDGEERRHQRLTQAEGRPFTRRRWRQ